MRNATLPWYRCSHFRYLIIFPVLAIAWSNGLSQQTEPKQPRDAQLAGATFLSYFIMDELSEQMWRLIADTFQETAAQRPNNTQIRAMSLFAQGQLSRAHKLSEKAEISFWEAIKADPSNPLPWLGLAEHAMDTKDGAKAEIYLMSAEALVKKSAPADICHLYFAKTADLYVRAGRYTEATKNYGEALAVRPDWPNARRNLAKAYSDTNQHQKALDELLRVAKIEPGNAYNHFSLGIEYNYLGRLDEAIQSFTKAAELDPGNPRYHYILGLTFKTAGNRAAAQKSFEAALLIAEKDRKYADLVADIKKSMLGLKP